MPFNLKVEFLGLCLHVHDPASGRAAVLMPDARRHTDPVHVDGREGAPHVGYLRFNLADLVPSFPAGTQEVPAFECIRLFDRQELGFGPPGPVTVDLPVPEFEKIAPHADDPQRSLFELKPGLFSPAPPDVLLMRTILPGGTLQGYPNESWRFPDLLTRGTPYRAEFANAVVWTYPVDADDITIRLTDFAQGSEIPITLRPADGVVVRLKIGNLCDKNPMEWDDLGIRQANQDDVDFKWIYRLLQPTGGTFEEILQGQELPIPREPVVTGLGVEDCLSGKITSPIP